MRISDWSSDVCSSDLRAALLGIVRRDHWVILRQVPLGAIILGRHVVMRHQVAPQHLELLAVLKTYNVIGLDRCADRDGRLLFDFRRSEEHTSELQSLMRISYAVFCLKKNKTNTTTHR